MSSPRIKRSIKNLNNVFLKIKQLPKSFRSYCYYYFFNFPKILYLKSCTVSYQFVEYTNIYRYAKSKDFVLFKMYDVENAYLKLSLYLVLRSDFAQFLIRTICL